MGCTGPTDTVQIDTNQVLIGQYSYPSPLGNWYHGTRHQMIYRASELTAAGIVPGNLSGLAFYIDNMAGATPNLTGMRIKIGCTPDSVAVVFNDTATVEVFPPTDVTIGVGWNWFDFADPFYWNGVDNIIVETCFDNATYTYNPYMACMATAYTSTVYYRADLSTVCGTSTISGTSTDRPIVRFTNCAAVPDYPYIYSWNTGSSADTTIVPGGMYVLTVSDGTGCEITDTVVINESAPVNIDDVTICETNPTDYSASSTFNSYMWSTGESGQTISISTGGTYYVDAVDSLGCPTSDTAFVSTLPVPVLSATSTDEIYGSDGYIDLLVYGAAYPFIIDWDNDGTGDMDDTEDLFDLTAGDYTVTVTDTNGCYSVLTVTVNSQLGIGGHTQSIFNIYPNPTSGLIYVQPINVAGNNIMGEITDVTGRLVQKVRFSGNGPEVIDLSGNERGIYYIRLSVDDNFSTTKIVLE